MHLAEARLAEADHTADERAHLQSCVRCRIAARRLNIFLDDTSPSIVASEAQRFTVVRSLGVGGMSQVVLSVDSRLGREVARKKLRTVTSARDVERFVREANITARLEHPNIVPVYNLEVDPQGSPTLTMRVVRGTSLGEAMRTGALPDRRARLEVFLKVCDAIAFAHSKGIVHRDLKPDNVMVGEFGEVQVVDFGLAAQEATEVDATSGGSAGLTRSGTVMGTPAYMSPEQARGENNQVGPASDVYGLGATLWEIVSGRPPFVGEADAVVAQVALGHVPSPKEVDPSVPEDLAAIVLRAMASDPRDRYPDVSALRRDVVSFLAHAPVSARVPTIADRLAHWFARNRGTVMPVAATAVLALLVLIAGLAEWGRQATTARDAEREQRVRVNLEAGSRAFLHDEPIEALPYFAQVLRLVEGTDQERDARARLRSAFERVPRIVSMARTEPWSGADLTMPTGRIAVAGMGVILSMMDGIQVFDASGKLTVAGKVLSQGPQRLTVAWSPDGAALAVASTVDVEIRRAEDLALLSQPLTGMGQPSGMWTLWWSREGNRIYSDSVNDDRSLLAYDVATATATDAWRTPPDVQVVALSPSGIVGRGAPSGDGLLPLALYDVETGRKIRDLLDVEPGDFLFAKGSADHVAIQRSDTGLVDIVPLAAPDLRRSVRHGGVVYDAAFSPDGRLFATASRDGTARVWDTRTASGVTPFLPHLDQVFDVSFPDHRYLMTASADGLVRVWHLLPGINERAAAVAVAESVRFALVLDDLGLSCVDLHDGRTLGRVPPPPTDPQSIQSATFDASGRWASVAWTSAPGILIDAESCRIVLEAGGVAFGSWNPVVPIFLGEQQIVGDEFFWTPERGREPRPDGYTAWSPDGGKVALADLEAITIWNPTTGDRQTIAEGDLCWLVAWGPSIAAGCGDKDGIRLLDPDTGRLLRTLHGTEGAISLAWSPDGRRLAVGEGSGLVTVWDAASGVRLATTTVPITPETAYLHFTQEGRYLAGRGYYTPGVWTVWNASTGELVARLPLGAGRPPTLTPSGFIVGLEIPTDDLSVADWLDIAELYSLQRVTETGVDIPTPERLDDLWRGLAERDPADFRFAATAPTQ